MTINNGGPAFPHVDPRDHAFITAAPEMSLRDWFAGQALAGACAKWCENAQADMDPDALVAKWAYEIADAMIAARNA